MVDVVILSWNRPDSTIETLRNILAQEGVRTTISIVDQGSSDECVAALRDVASEHNNVELIKLAENIGVAAGRNLGMNRGQADYIVAIDNDAVFEDASALARAACRMADEQQLGAIGFRIVNNSTGEDDYLNWVYPRSLLKLSGEEFLATRFCGAGHALRRSALESTTGYDEALFFYWEETDLCYQLIESGYSIVYDPSIVVRHRISPATRIDWSKERFFFLVRNAIYLDWKYFRSPPRLLGRILGYHLKGLRNRVLGQAVRGAAAAMPMIRTLGDQHVLSARARKYVVKHDTRYRGSLVRRFRDEVIGRLP